MSKFTPSNFNSLQNETSFLGQLNAAMERIKASFDNTLSRDGSVPNQMEATLDMNSNHVINLPEPAHGHEPLRLQDITNFIDQFALVQTPSPGDAGKIIRVRADEIAYDISSIQINAGDNAIHPVTNDSSTLGQLGKAFSDLFLASGAVINFNSGDVTLTHSADKLEFQGGTYGFDNKIYPITNDGSALGDTTHQFSDLFLASGAVINFNNSDVTITHSTDVLAFAGASTNYTFDANVNPATNDGAALGTTSLKWADLFLASGAVINFNSSDVTITHSTDQLTIGGLGAYTVGSTGGLQVNNDIVSTGGAIYALGGAIPVSTSVPGVYFGKESANNNRAIQIVSPAAGSAYIDFAPVSVDFAGRILYDTSANTFTISVNGASEVGLSATSLYPTTSDGTALGTSSLMWSDLFLAAGGVINFNNSDVTITHSTDQINFAGATNGFRFGNAVLPATSDGAPLGSTGLMWSDLFLANGGVINFNNGDYTIIHSSGTLTTNGSLVLPTSATLTTGAVTINNGAADGGDLTFKSSGFTDWVTDNSSGIFRWFQPGTTYMNLATNGLYPGSNDQMPLGLSSNGWSDLFLASGAVVNFANGNYTLTHSTDVLTANKDLRVTTAGTNATSVATLQGTQTFTSKSIDLANNTLTGTTAQFNTALSDDDFATLTNSVTLTNKTLTSPSISNPTISGTLTNTQATVFSGVITPSLSADVNDWAPSGFSTATTILLTGTGGWQITGLAGGSNGRLILVFNADAANTFIIKNNSSSSAAANRIQCNTDLSLLPGTGCLLYYETTNNFWRLVGGGGAGGGIANAYSSITDGTTTANAAGTDTIKFRVGSTGGITAAVGSNDPTHGDNLLISLDINGLTADTSPDRQADKVVTYDASASVHKSVLLKDIVYPQCTVQVFTSSGTWNRPTGCRRIKAIVTGGGSGGSGVASATDGLGGCGAASTISYVDVTGISSLTVTVGAGSPGSVGSSSTTDGGASSLSGSFNTSAPGGIAGFPTGAVPVGTGGTINLSGGYPVSILSNLKMGGSSYWGWGPARPSTSGNGQSSTVPGTGGGGAYNSSGTTSRTGGDGGDGIVVIEEFY